MIYFGRIVHTHSSTSAAAGQNPKGSLFFANYSNSIPSSSTLEINIEIALLQVTCAKCSSLYTEKYGITDRLTAHLSLLNKNSYETTNS
jgi:hypothetical protein